MTPSIKALDRVFPGKGRELKKALSSSDYVYAHPAGITRVNECYTRPPLSDVRMTVLDAIAETHGVEAIFSATGKLLCTYLNTGDSYAQTIIRYRDGRYRLGSWGDVVERNDCA